MEDDRIERKISQLLLEAEEGGLLSEVTEAFRHRVFAGLKDAGGLGLSFTTALAVNIGAILGTEFATLKIRTAVLTQFITIGLRHQSEQSYLNAVAQVEKLSVHDLPEWQGHLSTKAGA